MEGNAVTDPVPALQELEITSAPETGPGLVEQMATISSGQGHGSEASYPQPKTQDKQVQILKENWKTFLTLTHADNDFDERTYFDEKFETNPWFERVVSKLQAGSCLDNCDGLEIDKSLTGGFMSEWKMKCLDVAILMGDTKMVEKILEASSDSYNVIKGLLMKDERDVWNLIRDLYLNENKPDNLYTSLHLAVVGRNTQIVHVLLEKGFNINAPNWLFQTPLDYARKMENKGMLQKLLKKDEKGRKIIHVAVQLGDMDLMKKLDCEDVNVKDYHGRTPWHYLAASTHHSHEVMTNIVKYLVQHKTLDINVVDDLNYSALYVATLCCNTQLVIALVKSFGRRIRLNQECSRKFGPPIRIASERGENYQKIEEALMNCDSVKDYVESLYRDRQVYIDGANAILVGAALIASVTFASWLQPPLNYTSYSGEGYSSSSSSDLSYVDVEHNIALRAFWIFNALSFYFAIATVVCGARSVLPRGRLFIQKTVQKLHTNLLVTSALLACSMLFVIISFAIAGTIVLTPLLNYQWYMIVPTIIGGLVCIISLVLFIKSIVGNSVIVQKCIKKDMHNALEGKDYIANTPRFRIWR